MNHSANTGRVSWTHQCNIAAVAIWPDTLCGCNRVQTCAVRLPIELWPWLHHVLAIPLNHLDHGGSLLQD